MQRLLVFKQAFHHCNLVGNVEIPRALALDRNFVANSKLFHLFSFRYCHGAAHAAIHCAWFAQCNGSMGAAFRNLAHGAGYAYHFAVGRREVFGIGRLFIINKLPVKFRCAQRILHFGLRYVALGFIHNITHYGNSEQYACNGKHDNVFKYPFV